MKLNNITRLVIFGNGGHSRSLLNVVLQSNQDIDCVTVSNNSLPSPWPAIPSYTQFSDIPESHTFKHFIVAIGDGQIRMRVYDEFSSILLPYSVLASTAWISPEAVLGNGIFIGNSAHIGPFSKIGNNTIINTHAVIEHDVEVGSHSHVSVNAKICGNTKVGNQCFIGSGATIIDNLHICDNVTIGAGAVVIKDIIKPGTYVGVPAKLDI